MKRTVCFSSQFWLANDAAIIMSLEAVFAAIFGTLLLAEKLGGVQILGGVLILAAMLLAQFTPDKNMERSAAVPSAVAEGGMDGK